MSVTRFLSTLICLFSMIAAKITESDPSGLVSVLFQDGQWNITAEMLDWSEDEDVIARCCIFLILDTGGPRLVRIHLVQSPV